MKVSFPNKKVKKKAAADQVNAEASKVDLNGSKPGANKHEAGKTLKQDRESSSSKGFLVRGTKCYQRGIYNNLGQEEEGTADPNISTDV